MKPETDLSDIVRRLDDADGESRARVADRVTDLFVVQAPRFSDAHVALFDQIIGMLADAIEARARARLSEKLADVPNAPPGVIERFASDEIAVARPVLARSPRLTPEQLIAAARKGGRGHMLAITERKDLPESVTDVLLEEGDRVVVNAVAGNPGARFSEPGYDSLVRRAADDQLLQATVARRRDIPPRHMAALFELAKKAVCERLERDVARAGRRAVRDAVNVSARAIAAETQVMADAYEKALAEVSQLIEAGRLDDEALSGFAARRRAPQAACGLAALARVSIELAERALVHDHDLLLILARCAGLSWATVRSLLAMDPARRPGPAQVEALSVSFDRLTTQTAERLLHFLRVKEAAQAKA